MRHTLQVLILLSALATALSAAAQNRSGAQPIPEPPPPPPGYELDPAQEPQVTIRKRGEDTVEEFRINGKLYMMKVTPVGSTTPYYLIDHLGDGNFTRDDLSRGTGTRPPMWVIFSW